MFRSGSSLILLYIMSNSTEAKMRGESDPINALTGTAGVPLEKQEQLNGGPLEQQ